MKAGAIPNWILGGNFRFSSKTNDPLNGGFWLFQIQSDGTHEAGRKALDDPAGPGVGRGHALASAGIAK